MRTLVLCFLLTFLPFLALSHGDSDNSNAKNQTPKKEASFFKSENQRKRVFKKIQKDYQDTLKPLVRRKCYDCHSDSTEYPWYASLPLVHSLIQSDIEEGKEHLNFSKGFPFGDHATARETLEELQEVAESNSMPIWEYKLMHWNSWLTQKDRQKITQWVQRSLERFPEDPE